jgi:hypothetical protein
VSRRTREVERLRQDMARVIGGQADPRLRVPRAEAKRIKAEAEAERAERRASSMRVLLWRQYAPWVAAFGVMILGSIGWLLRWIYDSSMVALTFASLVGLALAWAAWMIGHRTKRWRTRLHVAAGIAGAWLLWTSATGPSWRAVLVLTVGTVVSSSSWWKANRPPHPKAPSVPVPVVTEQSIPVLWAEKIGSTGGAVPYSRLSNEDTSDPDCTTYQINLDPGRHEQGFVLSQLGRIASGLSLPVKKVFPEPHPTDENPNHMLLTVVHTSPIDETLPYLGARLSGERRNIIDVGPYGDAKGWAPWRMWAPGEEPMTGSWLSGFIVGGTGIGKSRLMELLAAGYMASGYALVWFADPQGGASSPALKEYADWYVDAEGTPVMLAALERIAAARELENSSEGWTRFDPSPERPGIVVFLDECQVTFGAHGKRWANLARKVQKVGISFVGLTQYASLESLGGQEPLRASLLANAIVMKANSKENKNLITGLDVNPETLPKIPGFGYVIGVDGTRTAPFRAEYLADPARWFEEYRMAVLDALSANAAGQVYQGRRQTQAELHESNRQKVAAMRGGTYRPEVDEPDLDDESPAEPGAFKVMQFPSPVAPPESPRPQDVPSWQRILTLVGQGVTRTAEIQKAVGLSPSQTAAVLKQLLEDKRLEQPTRGVYAVAGSASQPVR